LLEFRHGWSTKRDEMKRRFYGNGPAIAMRYPGRNPARMPPRNEAANE
jgi:hypothetical protein